MNDKKDWVTARSLCSLPKIFKELRLQVEEDVKTRNALRPDNSPYKFSVTENGAEFTVLLEAESVTKSVIFSLAGHAIGVRARCSQSGGENLLNRRLRGVGLPSLSNLAAGIATALTFSECPCGYRIPGRQVATGLASLRRRRSFEPAWLTRRASE